jgi:hypothetical protein
MKIGGGNVTETPEARISNLSIDISFDTMLIQE